MSGSKRKGPDGLPTDETWQFEVLASTSAVQRDFALPWDLYLLAAMNLADTSVEPLDVAFLRRFTPYRLEPGREPIVAHLGLDLNTVDSDIPETAGVAADAYRAAIRAWEAVNRRIALGRGPDFRIGHGVFLEQPAPDKRRRR